MYKGWESKFLTVCNHGLICLSMCQGVLFICTCCLLGCVHRRGNGAMWWEHESKIPCFVPMPSISGWLLPSSSEAWGRGLGGIHLILCCVFSPLGQGRGRGKGSRKGKTGNVFFLWFPESSWYNTEQSVTVRESSDISSFLALQLQNLFWFLGAWCPF